MSNKTVMKNNIQILLLRHTIITYPCCYTGSEILTRFTIFCVFHIKLLSEVVVQYDTGRVKMDWYFFSCTQRY